MPYLTLTNTAKGYEGHKITLNTDLVVTVHSATVPIEGTEVMETKTYLFCPPHGTWEVAESHDEVVKQLNRLVK